MHTTCREGALDLFLFCILCDSIQSYPATGKQIISALLQRSCNNFFDLKEESSVLFFMSESAKKHLFTGLSLIVIKCRRQQNKSVISGVTRFS